MKQFLFLSLFLFIACNAPKAELQTADEVEVVKMDNTSQDMEVIEETSNTDAVAVEKATEKVEEAHEPNLYMDPFDPDFISGKWAAEEQNGFSFDAWFYVEDGYVSGQYCAMNKDASRIDCGTQDEVDACYLKSPYLVGKKILEIDVVSCYALKKGKATIEPYGDGNMKWTLTKAPGIFGVDHFAPDVAIMYKKSFDPWD